ncbi:hypothetical protein K435DRAFT_831306 [Dendrothele bispora CBS 962.96]|uniref:Complex 1 LYR protein domain-containing protein n=1 Tax=Dendrothele bispora (strain CBS 962.96) TaxID=1314807 RepID=A0A4S8L7N8_DENBC|nr:hypothetical protein K435DRAFT_831306 [Dendrothele bispora CBS 962.96]
MSAVPSRRAILSLYSSTLRTAKSFSSYNFKNYFVRRTRDVFRSIQAEQDPSRVQSMYQEAVQDLTVMRRSAIVNQLYGGWKLAVEDPAKPVLERSDN